MTKTLFQLFVFIALSYFIGRGDYLKPSPYNHSIETSKNNEPNFELNGNITKNILQNSIQSSEENEFSTDLITYSPIPIQTSFYEPIEIELVLQNLANKIVSPSISLPNPALIGSQRYPITTKISFKNSDEFNQIFQTENDLKFKNNKKERIQTLKIDNFSKKVRAFAYLGQHIMSVDKNKPSYTLKGLIIPLKLISIDTQEYVENSEVWYDANYYVLKAKWSVSVNDENSIFINKDDLPLNAGLLIEYFNGKHYSFDFSPNSVLIFNHLPVASK